ncbi:putative protein kinase RLK-Pelle-RLCK-X family [Helianthus anomalus]
MKIALDTARELEYLHENCKPSVIHRDLKSSNILLDSSFNAKVLWTSPAFVQHFLICQSNNNAYFLSFSCTILGGD